MKGLPMLRREILGAARFPVTATSRAPITRDRTARKAGTRLIKTITWKVDLDMAS